VHERAQPSGIILTAFLEGAFKDGMIHFMVLLPEDGSGLANLPLPHAGGMVLNNDGQMLPGKFHDGDGYFLVHMDTYVWAQGGCMLVEGL
jgi:hypothetical protein